MRGRAAAGAAAAAAAAGAAAAGAAAGDDDDEDAEQANAMRKEMQVVQVQINEVESAVKASSALHEKLDELIAFVGAHPHFQQHQEPSKVHGQGSRAAQAQSA